MVWFPGWCLAGYHMCAVFVVPIIIIYSRPPPQRLDSTAWIFILILSMFVAGRPQPAVRWLINGDVVDDQYEHNFGDVIENRLMQPPLYRENLGAIFTCQAVNTLIVKPKESSYVLDMLRKSLLIPCPRCKYHVLISFSLHHRCLLQSQSLWSALRLAWIDSPRVAAGLSLIRSHSMDWECEWANNL